MACLVEHAFPSPTVAFVPANIVVKAPTPTPRARVHYSPVRCLCRGCVVLPVAPAIDGLVDLFGSLPNLRTAIATQQLAFALDGFSLPLPCGLGMLGEPELSDATALRDLLLNDAAYDWSRDIWENDDSAFTARLTFSSSAPTIVAEIAPRTGIVRILVDARETGRAKLRLASSDLELLLVRTRHSTF
jgi:hypothetical protein